MICLDNNIVTHNEISYKEVSGNYNAEISIIIHQGDTQRSNYLST